MAQMYVKFVQQANLGWMCTQMISTDPDSQGLIQDFGTEGSN